ncbi:MAG TPA: ABC transporter ATP-binding protein [Flavisolibacter sp.]|jgi:ABC-2 type transport system ATP-binding protein|nr:ABC transporter ATP-binding protein [Flavisolibacter sp.]
MTTTPIIQTTGLTYHFNKQQKTLDNINLRVEKGSIYGFLGPNGAGKTTTLRLLLGLLKKQEGSIRLFGKEFDQHRLETLQNIGSLIEQPSLYGHLTATENLQVYRKVYGASKENIGAVLQLVGLEGTGAKKAKQFSLGMKQRLSIAVALLHNPELLILDEPTNGLDPNGIIETRELIKKLNREKSVTIIVSSHILAEVERMATHVGIIHKGKLLFQGTLPELQNMKNQQSFLQLDTSDNETALQLLAEQGAALRNGYIALPFTGKNSTAAIARRLIAQNIDVYLLQPQQNDLEQLFIDITSTNNV